MRSLRARESQAVGEPAVARFTIISAVAVALVLLVANLYAAVVEGRRGGSAINVQAFIGLVCLGLSTPLTTSSRTVLRRGALVVLVAIGSYGVASLIESFVGATHLTTAPPNTALLFGCLGFGVAAGHHASARARWFADGLVIAGGVISLFALISLLFGSSVQYPITGEAPMTIATASLGLLVAGAVIFLRSDRGIGKVFNSNGTGGILARRLVPVLIVLPIAIARLMYLGVEAGTYDPAFAISVGVLIGVVILTISIITSATVLDRLDTVRRGNEAQIRQMVGDIARQSKELARSNQELESFSYSVSHDLRAPIRHIAGFTELLAKSNSDKLDDKGKRYIAMITDSAQQAGTLIDDLLEFSRMGRAEIKTREVPLDDTVRDAWSKLGPERTGRDIALRLSPLPTVQADPAMLEVVVGNLLSNAIKYTATKPRAEIEVGSREDGDDVVISVRDNGVGFDNKYVDKLFGVFQRLHGDEFEGVGIGLANVKRIVERHGGRVWAEGEVDRGASFHFTMPRKGLRS